MALVPCRECKTLVSTEALNCPSCGTPNPSGSSAVKKRLAGKKPPSSAANIVRGLAAIVLLSGIAYCAVQTNSSQPTNSGPAAASTDSPPSSPQAVSAPTCSTDWHSCKDNADLVNNSTLWPDIQGACQTAVNNEVKYGEPKWPGLFSGGAFASFTTGNDYVASGLATAIEPDVQVQNGFGAYVHSTARCIYDLNSKTVVNASVDPN